MGKKALYLGMSHHPQVILDAMEQLEKPVRRHEWGRKLKRVGAGAALVLFLPFPLILVNFFGPGKVGLGFYLPSVFLIIAVWILVIPRLWRTSRYAFVDEHLAAARQILHTLRDDTGRKGRVTGWLDLTGPWRGEKVARKARSASGKSKVYYQDSWFSAKIKLVDGNLLRLTLKDKIKTKAGSVVGHRTQLKAKLMVNPTVYREGAFFPLDTPLDLRGTFLSDENGGIVITGEEKPREVVQSMTRLSEMLGDLYSSLMARAAEENRPQEFVIHLYQRMAKRRIKARGRRNYAKAADYLSQVRAVHRHFNEEATWRALIASIREQHRRLPAFQQELTNAGL